MAKKSKKLKSIQRVANTNKTLNYTKQKDYFYLKNKKIITSCLSNTTKQSLIELEKAKLLPGQQSQDIINIQLQEDDQKNNKQIILTQSDTIQLIKKVYFSLIPNILQQKLQNLKQQSLQLLFQSEDPLYQKYQNQLNRILPIKSYIQKTISHKVKCYELKFQNQVQEKQRKLVNKKNKFKKLYNQAYCRLEKEILVESICMIIERNQLVGQNQFEIFSVFIMEQSYPVFQMSRQRAIQLIGEQNYQKKIKASMQVYKIIQIDSTFSNSGLICCHECMRIIPKIKKNKLFCQNKSPSCSINNQALCFSPYAFLERNIKGNYFENNFPTFDHPYMQYHILQQESQKMFETSKYQCNRYWCLQCYLNLKKSKNSLFNDHNDIKNCQYCSQNQQGCKCKRCMSYKKLIQLSAYYMDNGGDMKELDRLSVFKRIFQYQRVIEVKRDQQTRQLIFESQLKQMYDGLSSSKKLQQRFDVNIVANKRLKNEHIAYEWSNCQILSQSMLNYSDQRRFSQIVKTQKEKFKQIQKQKKQRRKQKFNDKLKKIIQKRSDQIDIALREQVEEIKKKFYDKGVFKDKLTDRMGMNESMIRSKTTFEKMNECALGLPIYQIKQFSSLWGGRKLQKNDRQGKEQIIERLNIFQDALNNQYERNNNFKNPNYHESLFDQ